MIDVKKLVTGFLVLAAIASASAFGLSYFGRSGNAGGVSQVAVIGLNGTSSQNDNAFLPQDPTASLQADVAASAASSTLNATDTANNLTDVIANAYLNNIISANPNGPQADSSGDPTFASPNIDALAAAVATSSALTNFQAPDWDIDVADQKLTIATGTSPEAVAEYGSELANILDHYFNQANFQNILNASTPDPTQVPFIQTQVQGALENTTGLTVPSNLANFQKSLVTVLVYENEALTLTQNVGADPAATMLSLNDEQSNYQTALANFQTQLQDVQAQNIFSVNTASSSNSTAGVAMAQPNVLASIQSVFGVPVAHAQFGGIVSDPVTEFETGMTVAQIVWQYLQQILLQVMKNTLVAIIQNNVLKWIQTGTNGAPRFVQNWAGTFSNAFTGAANGTIAQITPHLSTGFSGIASGMLQGNTSPAQSIQSTIDQEFATMGTSQQGFYNNFNSGGLGAYVDLFQPDNNLFGAVMDSQDAALAAGSNQAAAAQAKTSASNGYNGDEYCIDELETPEMYPNGQWAANGQHYACQIAGGGGYNYTPEDNNGILSCDNGDELVQVPNNGLCSDGSEPTVSTPGQVTSQAAGTAVGSDVQLIVNADNWTEIAIAVANSFLNNLITQGTKKLQIGVNGLLNTGANSYQPNSQAKLPNNILGGTTSGSNVQCSGPATAQVGATVAFSATGGGGVNNLGTGATVGTYSWTGGGVPATATGPSLTTTFNAPGTDAVTVSDSMSGGVATCNITVTAVVVP